jgi:hypothetical protein
MSARQGISFVLLLALNVYIGAQLAAASVTLFDWWHGVWAVGIACLIALDIMLVIRILDEPGEVG